MEANWSCYYLLHCFYNWCDRQRYKAVMNDADIKKHVSQQKKKNNTISISYYRIIKYYSCKAWLLCCSYQELQDRIRLNISTHFNQGKIRTLFTTALCMCYKSLSRKFTYDKLLSTATLPRGSYQPLKLKFWEGLQSNIYEKSYFQW